MDQITVDDPVVEQATLQAPRFRLEHGGRSLEVACGDIGWGHKAQLFIDGKLHDEQRAASGRAELSADGFRVCVVWDDFGRVKTCVLILNGSGHLTFTPPEGSHAARVTKLRHDYPSLYAARHLVKPVLQALVPLLGIGALLTALLPRFEWTWLPPFIRDKLFGDGPAWLEALLDSPVVEVGKWVVPIVLALFVALDEYEKHRKSQRETPHGPHR